MSTAQLLRPQEKTGTWNSIFPTEQVTEQQSALFVKKLLAVAISNVTYLRAIFPEHAFGDRCLEDLNLKILRDDSSCPGACQVIKWVKGCFDALDKKYLRMLIIGIFIDPEDPETVIESYTFKFSYSKDGGIDIYRNSQKISSAYTAAETRKATIRLLRTIVVLTQTLNSLPDDVLMTMKLLYYDEVTPPDYEPPGFKASELDGFKFDKEPTNIKVGDVATPFHTVKLRIKTDGKQFQMKQDPIHEAGDNDLSLSQISNNGLDEDAMEVDKSANGSDSIMANRAPEENYCVPSEKDVSVPTISPCKLNPAANKAMAPVPQSNEAAAEDYKVRCPCGCNEDDGLMIMCEVCKFWQHGVCFLIIEEENAPEKHFCDVCASKEHVCTDPQLTKMTSIAVQATCLWRRALMACVDINRVLPPNMARRLGVEMTVAQGLINRLEKEKYIKNPGKGKKLGKVVDKTLIKKEGIPKYFTRVETEKTQNMPNEKQVETQKEVELLITDENNKRQEKDVEMLVEQTERISIRGQKSKLRGKSKGKGKGKSKLLDTVSVEDKVLPDSSKRGKKRAFSKVDNSNEFELCHSQDVEDYHGVRPRCKKASVVSKAIMV